MPDLQGCALKDTRVGLHIDSDALSACATGSQGADIGFHVVQWQTPRGTTALACFLYNKACAQ